MEECDDGNLSNTDMCLATCKLATCGDTFVQAGVEQCDDGNLINTDPCVAGCLTAKCGDGFVQAGVDECDDGNMVNTDMCINTCKLAKCGDGVTQMGVEECDDGNMNNADTCSNACKAQLTKFVFVTSITYTGNLGGLDGADAKCNARAMVAGIGGTYRAWLSDMTGSPSTRMSKAGGPYRLVNGTVVANNWADLTDGNLITAINLTELGTLPPQPTFCGPGNTPVWTNTTTLGTLNQVGQSCGTWNGTDTQVQWGRAQSANSQWTSWCGGSMGFCTGNFTAPIYCIGQ
jgi:cysteine-rich repeat protein